MKKLINSRKLFSLLLAVMFLLSCSASGLFAADSDPNLVAWQSDYSHTTAAGTEDLFTFTACPADSDWMPTGFTDETGAENVTWSVVSGSTSGVYVADYYAQQIGDKWAATGAIYVEETADPGIASIEVENNATGATTNFSVVVDGVSPDVSNVSFRVYTDNVTLKTDGTASTVSGNDFYGNTSYPSVMDSIVRMLYTGAIDQYTYQQQYGTYVVRNMKVDGVWYYADDDTYTGWQYRVYRNNQLVELSSLFGPDEFSLQSNDVVMWKYGAYGAITFPGTLPAI
ncbi:MAG: hypothetical protein VB085_11715 [Peptococcaceae bacterium]|nr:hypothetical protein [Peptococcaceae bacterium]